jgi:hypothetical protein
MVYVRKSCLSPGDKAGEIPFVPAIPLCLKNLVQTLTTAQGSRVPVNVYALSTPYLCPILGVPVHRLNQVLAVNRSLLCPNSMDVMEAVLHLRIFFVLGVEISSLIWG